MFGMPQLSKKFIILGFRQYELVEVDGPIVRDGKESAVQFDHEAMVLRVCREIPADQKAVVVANAVADACLRMWRPVPVVGDGGVNA